jgi:glycosyltransferase involved in cell wall biosynthesis
LSVKPHKIVHLSTVHPADDPRVYVRESLTLAEAGYDVTVVGCDPRGGPMSQDEVTVRLLPRRRGRLRRGTFGLIDAVRWTLREQPTLVHFHDPELLMVAWIFRWRGIITVYDIHENLRQQILTKPYLNARVARALSRVIAAVEPIGARACDALVLVDPAWAHYFPKRRWIELGNAPRRAEWLNASSVALSDRAPIFSYIGSVSEIRGALDMVRAVNLLPDSANARLVIAGKVDDQLRARIVELDVHRRVDLVGWLSRDEIVELIGRSLAGMLLLHPVKNYLTAKATKLHEYMLGGVPTIATNLPGSRSVIEPYDCGVLVEPYDIEATAAAMTMLINNRGRAQEMADNGIANAECFDTQAPRLLGLYDDLLANHR